MKFIKRRQTVTVRRVDVIRQMAIHYGVSEQVINAVRREQHTRRFPGKRGRIALVNV